MNALSKFSHLALFIMLLTGICEGQRYVNTPLAKTDDRQTVEQVAAEVAKNHNALNYTDEMTVSSTAVAQGKQLVFTYIIRVKKDLPKAKLDEFRSEMLKEIVPKTCMANANNVAFMKMGLLYTFIYLNTYGEKLAEFTVDRAAYDKWKASLSMRNECINKRRLLWAAKEQWALAEKKKQGDAVVLHDMLEYTKHPSRAMDCPSGGTISIGAVGVDPKCSIHGPDLE